MPLSICVLGSGSRGNATALLLESKSEDRVALIDCGLSPRATGRRLAPLGLGIDRVTDILLTHLDTDHFQPTWAPLILRHSITVHVFERHRSRAVRAGLDGRCLRLHRDDFDLGGVAHVEPVPLAHDALGTVGFVIEHARTRLGFATDLGRVTPILLERFRDLHGLAIESNYDRRMQLASHRPDFLKRRIMGGQGHLSNDQSIEAVGRIDDASALSQVVTLHLSRQCNDPRCVKQVYVEQSPHLLDRLTITSQHEPTPVLRVRGGRRSRRPTVDRAGQQLAMFDAE